MMVLAANLAAVNEPKFQKGEGEHFVQPKMKHNVLGYITWSHEVNGLAGNPN
jgi:hypothetical protein